MSLRAEGGTSVAMTPIVVIGNDDVVMSLRLTLHGQTMNQ